MNTPSISIITLTYNSSKTISRCVRSLEVQTDQNFEHIVKDNQSTDNTLELVVSNKLQTQNIISQPDTGIYDGLNQAIAMATNDVIGILHSDDIFMHETIATVRQFFANNPSVSILCGAMVFTNDKTTHLIKPSLRNIRNRMTVNHTAMFVRKKIYQKKKYDTAYQIASDYKFILDCYQENINVALIDDVLTIMYSGGKSADSNTSINEVYQIQKELGNRINAQKNMILNKGRRLIKNMDLNSKGLKP